MFSLTRFSPRYLNRLFSTISVLNSNSTSQPNFNRSEFLLKKNLDDLMRKCRQYEKNLNGITHTQNTMQAELSKEQARISVPELKELLYLSKTDKDIDILAMVLNRYLMDKKIQWTELEYQNDFARIFMELLYFLKKTQKTLDLFHDNTYNRIFRSHRVQELLLRQLAESNLFDEFINVLKKQIPRYYKRVGNKEDGELINTPASSPTQQQQPQQRTGDPLVIPISHMNLITKFFLQQNTLQSFNAYKDLIYRIEKSGSEILPFFKLRFIVFALLQDQGIIAYESMRKGIFDKDIILNNNLRLLINSKMNRTEDCLRRMKNIFFYENPIFPFTLKMIRADLEKHKENEEYRNQIDTFYRRAYLESRLIDGEDLIEIVSGEPVLRTDVLLVEKFDNDGVNSPDGQGTNSGTVEDEQQTNQNQSKKNQTAFAI